MDEYTAVVEKLVIQGKHGPYAVARSDELGCVTFSLSKPVWQENGTPSPGTSVMLSDLREKRAGWRAMRGRFVRPSDKRKQLSNQS